MIKNIKLFKNETQYGIVFNATVEYLITTEKTIYFQVKRMPRQNGGHFYLWPQEVYNHQLAKETNFKKGVNKFLFANKAFNDEVHNAIDDAIAREFGEQQPKIVYEQVPTNEESKFESLDTSDINLEEIKF